MPDRLTQLTRKHQKAIALASLVEEFNVVSWAVQGVNIHRNRFRRITLYLHNKLRRPLGKPSLESLEFYRRLHAANGVSPIKAASRFWYLQMKEYWFKSLIEIEWFQSETYTNKLTQVNNHPLKSYSKCCLAFINFWALASHLKDFNNRNVDNNLREIFNC